MKFSSIIIMNRHKDKIWSKDKSLVNLSKNKINDLFNTNKFLFQNILQI
jgi:uncharacterized membrane protein YecN with MAPEG domain